MIQSLMPDKKEKGNSTASGPETPGEREWYYNLDARRMYSSRHITTKKNQVSSATMLINQQQEQQLEQQRLFNREVHRVLHILSSLRVRYGDEFVSILFLHAQQMVNLYIIREQLLEVANVSSNERHTTRSSILGIPDAIRPQHHRKHVVHYSI